MDKKKLYYSSSIGAIVLMVIGFAVTLYVPLEKVPAQLFGLFTGVCGLGIIICTLIAAFNEREGGW